MVWSPSLGKRRFGPREAWQERAQVQTLTLSFTLSTKQKWNKFFYKANKRRGWGRQEAGRSEFPWDPFLLTFSLSSSLIHHVPPRRPPAGGGTHSEHPHTHLASPVDRALRGIAETHVFIPSHFVQILQDLEEKRAHGRHHMHEDP